MILFHHRNMPLASPGFYSVAQPLWRVHAGSVDPLDLVHSPFSSTGSVAVLQR